MVFNPKSPYQSLIILIQLIGLIRTSTDPMVQAAARRRAKRGLHRGHRSDHRGQLDLHREVVEGAVRSSCWTDLRSWELSCLSCLWVVSQTSLGTPKKWMDYYYKWSMYHDDLGGPPVLRNTHVKPLAEDDLEWCVTAVHNHWVDIDQRPNPYLYSTNLAIDGILTATPNETNS